MCHSSSDPASQGQPQIVEQSSGFHIVELHLPSAGLSAVTVILCIIVGYLLAYFCCRRRCRLARDSADAHPSFPMMPMLPPSGFPNTVFVMDSAMDHHARLHHPHRFPLTYGPDISCSNHPTPRFSQTRVTSPPTATVQELSSDPVSSAPTTIASEIP